MRAARALWSLVRALSVSSAVLTRLVLTRLAGLVWVVAETDCRFACFNHGFAIVYSGTAAMLTSTYQGALCDCSVRGYFVGTVHLAGDMSIAATNTLNDSLTMKPVAAFNQLVLAVNSSDGYCSFAPNFAQGSLMGLPTEAPLRPSTKGVSPRNPGVSAHPHLHANPVSETQSWARVSPITD